MEKRHSRYFYKLLIIVLMTSIIPVILLIGISSSRINQELKNEISRINYQSLEFLGDGVDITMSQIKEGCRQMTLDYTFDSFLSIMPWDAKRYEEIMGPYSSKDLAGISNYFMLKSKIYGILDQQSYDKPFVDSVYCYDYTKRSIYTNQHEFYSDDAFYDSEIPVICKNILTSPYITPPRMMITNGQTGKRVISLIYGSIWRGDRKIIVVNIDTEKFAEYIFSQNSTCSLLIISDQGDIIAKSSGIPDSVVEKLTKNPQTVESVLSSANGKVSSFGDFILTKYSGSSSGWNYIQLFEPQVIYKSISEAIRIAYVIAVIIILIAGSMALASSRIIYRPILSLIQLFKAESCEQNNAEEHNIFKYIERRYSKMVYEQNNLKSKINALLPYFKEKVMISVLRTPTPDTKWLNEQIVSVELGFNPVGFAAFLFGIDSNTQTSNQIALISQEIVINEYLKQKAAMDIGCKSIVVSEQAGSYLLILNVSAEQYQKAYRFAADILEEIKEELKIVMVCGISLHHILLQELYVSRREAQEAMDSALFSGLEPIHFYVDAEGNNKPFWVDLSVERGKIINCIKIGNSQKAEEIFRQFIKKLCSPGHTPDAWQTKIEISKLLNDMWQTMIESGKSVEEVCPQLIKASGQVGDQDGTISTQQLIEIVYVLCDFYKEENSSRGNKKLSNIISLIDLHYTQNIGLIEIAEMAGINPDYLGRLFKEHTGKAFVEYVTNLRINRSKELLENTDMKIKAVGEAVGYPNCNYFIKVFKQYTDLTPKEYQNINRPTE